jgi:hypothetical protein
VWRFEVRKIVTATAGFCCVGFINSIGVVGCVWRQKLALSIGPNQ